MNDEAKTTSREARLDKIVAEFLQAEESAGPQDRRQWAAKHPEFAAELAEFFTDHDRIEGFAKHTGKPSSAPPEQHAESEPAGNLNPPLIPFQAQRGQPQIGDIFAGQYRVFGIKAGGMGRVYLADVIPLHRGDMPGKVAIKTIPEFEEWRERQTAHRQPGARAAYERVATCFRREAEIWVKIGKQQNVIWAFFVLDIGGKPYIVMEYAEDGDLRSWIAHRRITTPHAVNLAVQFCRGMTQAGEACGLVHRDIKPANVLLTKGGLVRVSDFGLSKAYQATESGGRGVWGESSVWSQAAAGTAAYMAPEQLVSLSNADTRSDIYSFGVMLFEMVTGDQLFGAMSPQEHLLRRGGPAPVLHEIKPDVPEALSAILTRCLAFEPACRYQTFQEVETDLLAVHASLPDPVPFPEADGEPPPDWHLLSEESSLLALGRFREAARRAEEGVRQFPRSAGHWINRGVALMHLGENGSSRHCLERATGLEPANALAWANLGWAKMENGDPGAGAQDALSATRLDPDLAEGWWTLGECNRKLGRAAEAIPAFQRAVQARTHEWRSHHYLGSCLLEAGHSAEAIPPLREAVHIHPENADAWRMLALAFGKLGRQGESRQAIDRAIELDPDNSDAWAVRAILLWHVEGPSRSVRFSLRKSLTLDSANPRSLQLLGMMGIHNLEVTT